MGTLWYFHKYICFAHFFENQKNEYVLGYEEITDILMSFQNWKFLGSFLYISGLFLKIKVCLIGFDSLRPINNLSIIQGRVFPC